MYICDLALDNFRSYEHEVLSFDPGPVMLIGSNGQGKTNIVEAIAYLATLSSHRAGTDAALVHRPSQPPYPSGAVVRARVMHGERPQLIELEIISGKANRARLNKYACSPREVLGIIQTVVFAPEDLGLIRDEPAIRRKFLDDLAITMTPRLAGVKADYDKVITQRASLLRKAKFSRDFLDDTLEVWNEQLASYAAQLIAARVRVLQRIRPFVAEAYHQVSHGQSQMWLTYRSSIDRFDRSIDLAQSKGINDQELCQELEHSLLDIPALTQRLVSAMNVLRDKECERGVNLIGAHRDDLSIFLNHLPVKGFASHGEQWSSALALRLGSFHLLRDDNQQRHNGVNDPILILDDVFAELDEKRRQRLTKIISSVEQTIITCAVEDDVPEQLRGQRLYVANSAVSTEPSLSSSVVISNDSNIDIDNESSITDQFLEDNDDLER
ncbi:DNA replication/repair protein RecF [Actinomyces vulturis]|uniref:DNA replication/repair protein RecF n=1 Tax=Actinomyces vulturis TaxID=1857645 RepID=UPI000833221B|nr:DNA replication/repair protein RecF [Actinomyces vulturis]